MQQDHSRGGGVALPYGKQGILVTIESSDPRRATKEAISVLEEVCSRGRPMFCAAICVACEEQIARQSETT